jgi:hypothetical protein
MLAPIAGTIFYLYILALLEEIFCNKKYNNIICPKFIYYFSIFHNSTLTIFSLYTFLSLYKVISIQGIHGEHKFYMSQPHIKTIVYWFYISKYYEYFDTVLLYCKGRKPIFLQKYHHIGAVICWHLGYKYDVDMFMFGSLFNSGVHTIMYFYYLLTIFKINIKCMRIYITIYQIVQLTSGSLLGLVCYHPPIETIFNYRIIILFNMYIYGLLCLFLQFMFDNYFTYDKLR